MNKIIEQNLSNLLPIDTDNLDACACLKGLGTVSFRYLLRFLSMCARLLSAMIFLSPVRIQTEKLLFGLFMFSTEKTTCVWFRPV